jgi:tripartite-type tricarboxylate transporter receptor subunit TctC
MLGSSGCGVQRRPPQRATAQEYQSSTKAEERKSMLPDRLRWLLAAGCCGIAGAAGAAQAPAEIYPQRPVRIVVNVTAGGGVDTTARVVAKHLNEVTKQPFVVDNRTGAGGAIGIETVAKATPDGHTLLVCSSGIVTNAAYRKQNYDPVRDFQPVSILTSTPYIVVVSPSLPIHSVRDLIALAKSKPGAVTFATSGMGAITHLGAELLPVLSGAHMLSVPYKGVADAYPAVASGEVNWMIGATISAMPLVKAGRLRAIAITSGQRSKALPDLPTVAESGVPGYEVIGWFALFAPAGTPRPIVDRLHAEAKRALHKPDFERMAEAQGTEIVASSPQELARVVRTEIETWRKVVAGMREKPQP